MGIICRLWLSEVLSTQNYCFNLIWLFARLSMQLFSFVVYQYFGVVQVKSTSALLRSVDWLLSWSSIGKSINVIDTVLLEAIHACALRLLSCVFKHDVLSFESLPNNTSIEIFLVYWQELISIARVSFLDYFSYVSYIKRDQCDPCGELSDCAFVTSVMRCRF